MKINNALKNLLMLKQLRLFMMLLVAISILSTLTGCASNDDETDLDMRLMRPQSMKLTMHDTRQIRVADLEETANYQLTNTKNSFLTLLLSEPCEMDPAEGFSISAVVIGPREKVIIPSNQHKYSIVVLKGYGVLYGLNNAYILKPASTLIVSPQIPAIKLSNTTKTPLSILVFAQPAVTTDYLDKFYQVAKIKYKDIVHDIKVNDKRELDKSDDSFQDQTFPKGAGTIPGKVETQVKKLEVLKKDEKMAPTYKNPKEEAELIRKQKELGIKDQAEQ
ncbi:hypothetical protein AAEX28_10120 [Lentisphaerota bacterium WC36G]|nr:hypothetical protein LJT99_12955 [Lentisphaerae bacterium WC36]